MTQLDRELQVLVGSGKRVFGVGGSDAMLEQLRAAGNTVVGVTPDELGANASGQPPFDVTLLVGGETGDPVPVLTELASLTADDGVIVIVADHPIRAAITRAGLAVVMLRWLDRDDKFVAVAVHADEQGLPRVGGQAAVFAAQLDVARAELEQLRAEASASRARADAADARGQALRAQLATAARRAEFAIVRLRAIEGTRAWRWIARWYRLKRALTGGRRGGARR